MIVSRSDDDEDENDDSDHEEANLEAQPGSCAERGFVVGAQVVALDAVQGQTRVWGSGRSASAPQCEGAAL